MKSGNRRVFNQSTIAVAVSLMFQSQSLLANPSGAQVVNGTVSITQPNASTLNVTNSPGAIINWQGFSIGAGEVTRFIQQSSSSAVLNRVVGRDISSIQGQLQSNGRVFLINPAGIVIGPNAMLDTAGFIGSTLNMQNADFLAGKLRFSGDATSGAIINQGWIRTSYGGNVLLVAPRIENSGLIQTPGGELILAAGQKVTVSSLEQEGVQFEVQAPTDSVVNIGSLLASGGAVGVFAGTLRHSGEIRANALTRDEGGRVVLMAQSDLTVASGSSISADGKRGGSVTVQSQSGTSLVSGDVSAKGSAGAGGDIRLLGNRVGVIDNALIDASGDRGGGQVLVGGDYQGKNNDINYAARTMVGPDTTLRADAISDGDGGKVIVWSDEVTRVYGAISARGGAQSGNGGFVETSGKQWLGFAASVNTSAPHGTSGTLLLDPTNIEVNNTGGAPYANGTNNFFGNPPTGGGTSVITATSINAQTGGVILQANNDVTFTSPVSIASAGSPLTVRAGRSIIVNADVGTNNSAVSFTANDTGATAGDRGAGAGAITMAPGTNINAGSGNVSLIIANNPGQISGNMTLANVTGQHLNVVHSGITANNSIVRADSASLLSGSSLFMDLEMTSGSGGIGTSAAPLRVAVNNLDVHYHLASGGIFLNSTQSVNIGGSFFGSGLLVRGLQTVSGGPLELTVNGTLSQVTGAPVACAGAGGGGPICAGAAGSTNPADALTLRATDMNLFMPVVGNSVVLLPQSGGTIGLGGGTGTLALSAAEVAQINTKALRIGERNGVGSDIFSSGDITGNITAPGTASIELRTGGSFANKFGAGPVIGTSNANITVNAGSEVGATGLFLEVNPGTANVNVSSASGNIFITQSTGNLVFDNWTLSSGGTGKTIQMSVANGGMSGNFKSNGNPNWTLRTLAAGKDIAFTGNGVVDAASLALIPTGSTTINSGTRTFNTPITTSRPLSIDGGDVTFTNMVTGSTISGSLTVASGTATFAAASSFGGPLTLTGSGTATFNAASTYANGALIEAGTLAGTGAVTINGGMTWTGGTIANTKGVTVASGFGGTTVTGVEFAPQLAGALTTDALNVTGPLQIGAGGVLNLVGSAAHTVDTATLTNSGTLNLAGTGNLILSTGATLTNNGILDFQSTAGIEQLTASGASLFNVAGATVKKTTSASSVIGIGNPIFVTNNGTIDVQAGKLQVNGGLPTNAGTISVAGGATFLNSGQNLLNTGTLTGNGTIDLGTALLTNDGVLRPGTSPGTLTINGNLTLTPTSTTEIEIQSPGLTAGSHYDLITVNGAATLGGALNVTHPGGFVPSGGQNFTIMNYTSRSSDFTQQIFNGIAYTATPNATNYLLTAPGGATINSWNFDGSDNWNVPGRWSLGHVPLAGEQVVIDRSAGLFTITVPAGTFSANSVTSNENLTIGGGALSLAGTSSVNATLAINSGSLTANGALSANTVNLSGGTLNGTGAVTVSNAFNWSGGTLAGAGLFTTANTAVSALSGAVKTLTGKTWDNFGIVNWHGGGVVLTDAAATINNRPGATWNILTTSPFDDLNGPGTFNNTPGAVIVGNAPGGSNSISPAVVNHAGTFNLLQGDLDFDNGSTINFSGALNMSNGTRIIGYTGTGSTLNFNSGFSIAVTGAASFEQNLWNMNVNSALTLPTGLILRQSGATTVAAHAPLTFASGASYVLSGGTLAGTGVITLNGAHTWSGGTMNAPVTVASGATLNLSGAAPKTLDGGTLTNAGTVNIAGSGNLVLSNGAAFQNNATLDFQSDAGMQNVSPGAGLINAGTLRKSAGSGISTIGITNPVNVTNTGQIQVQTGTLQVNGGFPTNSGVVEVGSGTTFSTNGNALANAGTIRGTGTINLAGATLTNNGMVAPGASPGKLIINGNYTQGSGGTLAIELAGTSQGVSYDLLQVNGIATLGGTLSVTTFSGYAPAVGNLFDFMTYSGSPVGNFSSFVYPAGLSVLANPNTNFYRLTVTGVSTSPPGSHSSPSASSATDITNVVVSEHDRMQQRVPNDEAEQPLLSLRATVRECS